MKTILKTVIWTCSSVLFITGCTKDLELIDIENPDVVTEPLDTKKEITEFLFLDFENDQLNKDILTTIDQDKSEIMAYVPYETNLEALVPRIAIPKTATIQPGVNELQDFTNPVEYTVTAQDGSQVVYRVIVKSVPFTQKEVLVAIYQSNPGNTLGWDLTNDDISTWEGVTVENGKIVELSLPEKLLSVLPPEIGSLSYLRRLIISRNKIITIPSEIGNLRSSLQSIVASDNSIRVLPDSFFDLVLLEDIRLFNNKLSTIPDGVAQLKNANMLSLSGNEFDIFPEPVLKLTGLEEFYINNNRINAIPEGIGKLINLKSLGLSNNPITTIPDEVFQLPGLERLYLRLLGLSDISDSFNALKKIELLDLSRNELTEINYTITNLTTLRRLNLNANQLMELPAEISNLTNLELLSFKENPLTIVPKAVCDLSSAGTEIEKDDTAICETM